MLESFKQLGGQDTFLLRFQPLFKPACFFSFSSHVLSFFHIYPIFIGSLQGSINSQAQPLHSE